MLIGVIDTLMIGHVGTVELAAAAFANVIFNSAFVFAIGLSVAISVQISHSHGATQDEDSAEGLRNGILLSVILSGLLSLAITAIIPFLELFRQPSEVVAITPPYLIWLALSMLPLVPAMVIKSFAEAMNHPWAVFWIMLVSVGLNLLFNYILIFGNFGSPAFGLNGAGAATFLARTCALVTLWYYLKKSRTLALGRPTKWIAPLNRSICSGFLKIGAPVSGQLSMEFGSFAAVALLIGQFGSAALAAHQVTIMCAAFTFMIPLGLSMAVTIRVGHTVGAGEAERGRRIVIGAQASALLMMACCATLFIACGELISRQFTKDIEVITIASHLLIVAGFFQFFDGAQVISMGALRGIRDVTIPTIIIFISFWLFGIPFGAVLGFAADMGPTGLWIGLASGTRTRCNSLNHSIIQKNRCVIC